MDTKKCNSCPLGDRVWVRCLKVDSMGGSGLPSPGPDCPFVLLTAKDNELGMMEIDRDWEQKQRLSCEAALAERDEKLATKDAEIEKVKNEMRRHLPILESLESKPAQWEWYADGTGIATLNGYRAALKEVK